MRKIQVRFVDGRNAWRNLKSLRGERNSVRCSKPVTSLQILLDYHFPLLIISHVISVRHRDSSVSNNPKDIKASRSGFRDQTRSIDREGEVVLFSVTNIEIISYRANAGLYTAVYSLIVALVTCNNKGFEPVVRRRA